MPFISSFGTRRVRFQNWVSELECYRLKYWFGSSVG
jgi:hypothetical protein